MRVISWALMPSAADRAVVGRLDGAHRARAIHILSPMGLIDL